METTIQAHRQMLRRLCTLGRIAGWAMIVIGVFGAGVLTYTFSTSSIPYLAIGMRGYVRESLNLVDHILTGLAVLGTVQFIRYVVEEDAEPKWLVRNGHIVLSLFAMFLLTTGVLRLGPGWWMSLQPFFTGENMIPMGQPLGIASLTFITFLPLVTKALCFLGMAAILRTVLPVMAESKTLA